MKTEKPNTEGLIIAALGLSGLAWLIALIVAALGLLLLGRE